MIDFKGMTEITIPEGNVVKITSGGTVLWEKRSGYTNQIPISTDANGNVVGLLVGYRYNSSDTLVALAGCCATGFIPIKSGDTVRFKGIQFRNEKIGSVSSGSYYIRIYDASFKQVTAMSAYNIAGVNTFFADSHTLDAEGDLNSFVLKDNANYAYMRMAFVPEDGVEAVITVNEEIV